MAVQDLTPQLRTRLSRVERAVGWFVLLATILLLAGFAYYVYNTAERKGWLLIKLPYHTYVQSAAGLHPGDPVMLMGFSAGQITKITAMPPFSTWGQVYVQFIIHEPYYGYIWTDSYVRVVSAGLLGNRSLEVVPGGTSTNKTLHASYEFENGKPVRVWDTSSSKYLPYVPSAKGYGFAPAEETPVVTERLEQLASAAEKALPGILDLTNKVALVLTNVSQLTTHADSVLLQAQPLMTNLAVISSGLTNGQGALGDWLLPTNVNRQLQQTLTAASSTLSSANTNVTMLAVSLDQTLINLGNITSNLNAQVQTNDQILSRVSEAVIHADQFVQGLKHHWLLRSAFKNEKSTPTAPAPAPTVRPRPGAALTNEASAEAPAASPSPAVRPQWPPARPKAGKRIP
jgi:ABC-type transporter Mla subunit MlaD